MSDSNDAVGTVSTVGTIDKVIANFPVDINNYREIFLGGGSVLLALLSYAKKDIIKIRGNIYAYDLHP